jgi:hypothetical protein
MKIAHRFIYGDRGDENIFEVSPGTNENLSQNKGKAMNHDIKIIILFALLLTILSCYSKEAQKIDIEKEKAEIEKVIDASIGWAMTKNLDLLISSVAQDISFFIYHPDSKSTIVGFEAFTKLSPFWMSPNFKATHYKIWDLRINFSRSGDVAWYSCLLEDCAEIKGKPGC